MTGLTLHVNDVDSPQAANSTPTRVHTWERSVRVAAHGLLRVFAVNIDVREVSQSVDDSQICNEPRRRARKHSKCYGSEDGSHAKPPNQKGKVARSELNCRYGRDGSDGPNRGGVEDVQALHDRDAVSNSVASYDSVVGVEGAVYQLLLKFLFGIEVELRGIGV